MQKQKRGKKVLDDRRNIPPVRVNEKNINSGFRFLALEINDRELNGDDETINVVKDINFVSMERAFIANADIYGNNSNNMESIQKTDGILEKEDIGDARATQEEGLKDTMCWLDITGKKENDKKRNNIIVTHGRGRRRQKTRGTEKEKKLLIWRRVEEKKQRKRLWNKHFRCGRINGEISYW